MDQERMQYNKTANFWDKKIHFSFSVHKDLETLGNSETCLNHIFQYREEISNFSLALTPKFIASAMGTVNNNS